MSGVSGYKLGLSLVWFLSFNSFVWLMPLMKRTGHSCPGRPTTYVVLSLSLLTLEELEGSVFVGKPEEWTQIRTALDSGTWSRTLLWASLSILNGCFSGDGVSCSWKAWFDIG